MVGLLDKVLDSRRRRAIAAAQKLYQSDVSTWEAETRHAEERYRASVAAWQQEKEQIEQQNAERMRAFEARAAKQRAAFDKRLAAWIGEKEDFEARQKAAAEAFNARQKTHNSAVRRLRRGYSACRPESIGEYCKLVLSRSKYPHQFPRKSEIAYAPESRTLVVEYSLPSIDHLPKVVRVRYRPERDDCDQVLLSRAALNRLFADVFTLRSLHELFNADLAKALDAIAFNGWVRALNKATGKRVNTCVLSVHTTRQAFRQVDLKHVDPAACFRRLKGVGSSALHGLVAVAPIMRIDRTDRRFIEAYGVAEDLTNTVNVAAMPWEDFEHLVREVFGKEFAQYGGDVKITQASRDGGVDAVAFDPDPIRGGKIVIQAKRYTNVVGVAAVRDLYGTVVNEGAIKGILVTTATYGPDAYEFAKDKPLTLLNGSNLLHMLERHGHKARIDLQEAKRILALENRR